MFSKIFDKLKHMFGIKHKCHECPFRDDCENHSGRK